MFFITIHTEHVHSDHEIDCGTFADLVRQLPPIVDIEIRPVEVDGDVDDNTILVSGRDNLETFSKLLTLLNFDHLLNLNMSGKSWKQLSEDLNV